VSARRLEKRIELQSAGALAAADALVAADPHVRALQEKEVRPVGGLSAVRIDLRVVAATHRDLEERVESEEFREDLLARLGASFLLPALAERREDLGILIAAILRRLDDPHVASAAFTVDAGRALIGYAWPKKSGSFA
jgi:DNA-binding NtrC family response regulator